MLKADPHLGAGGLDRTRQFARLRRRKVSERRTQAADEFPLGAGRLPTRAGPIAVAQLLLEQVIEPCRNAALPMRSRACRSLARERLARSPSAWNSRSAAMTKCCAFAGLNAPSNRMPVAGRDPSDPATMARIVPSACAIRPTSLIHGLAQALGQPEMLILNFLGSWRIQGSRPGARADRLAQALAISHVSVHRRSRGRR